jgi:hypothetical protein
VPASGPGPVVMHPSRVTVALVLAVACTSIGTVLAPPDSGDFWFFRDRAADMFGASGLRVFAEHPGIQSGPLTLLMARAIGSVDRSGLTLVPIVASLACGLVLVGLSSMTSVRAASRWAQAAGGLVVVAWWWFLPRYGHVDDALVLALAVGAVALVSHDRRVAAAVLLGVALAVKPWMVFLLPITCRTPLRRVRSWTHPALACGIGGVFWLPFVIADVGTLRVMRPTVPVSPESVMQLFGADPGGSAPAAARFVQLLLAFGAVTWVVRHERADLALLVGVAVRVAFDAATWPYYTVGLVVGAIITDAAAVRRARLPWVTAAVSLLVVPRQWWWSDDLRALLRLVACVAALAVVAADVRSGRPRGARSRPWWGSGRNSSEEIGLDTELPRRPYKESLLDV